jgi:nucleoside-diphosphate-sugar epimerase
MSMVSKYITSKKPIFVAGGTSGVGLEVVKQLVSQGNPVKCLVRRKESVDMLTKINQDLISCTVGDALDEAAVQECMNDCVAAVTTLGGKPSEDGGKRVDYFGNSNVVEQAGILGCERIILVTSIGCGPTKDAVGEDVYKVLEEALVAKDKAERDLRMYTNLDWTIIRPGGLKSDAPTGKAILTDDVSVVGTIHRADVASLVLKALASEGKATRKELSAVDPSVSENLNEASAFDV